VEAVYDAPYQAHATMEPMNCTARVDGTGCEIWAPTQAPDLCQKEAAKLTGLPPERIRVHTTLLGCGFGRRAEVDFVREAVEIAQAVGAPVKVVWTREDDMGHDFYRPASHNRLVAMLDESGTPVGWQHRIVGPSIMTRWFPDAVKNGVDSSSVEGASDLPYAIPHIQVDYVMEDPGVPVGFWRSVGSSQNAWVVESFLDEVAHAAKQDPVELRRRLLRDHPRHRKVLELAAEKAGWDSPPPAGRARGVAVHESFASFVAQVAEVSVTPAGRVRVHRVVCAVDCGAVVNPDIVRAQMEGAIAFGLCATLLGAITVDRGRAMQSNFGDFPLLRYDEMPEVEVHIVPGTEPPGGVGEPGTPPIAPAVANAVFAATGRRVRRLPIRAADLRTA
jgi:isoquinoline 1-oxidoreductase beta subunit